jgi:hypothetical protein
MSTATNATMAFSPSPQRPQQPTRSTLAQNRSGGQTGSALLASLVLVLVYAPLTVHLYRRKQ